MRFAIYIPGDGRAAVDKLTEVGLGHLRGNAAGISTPVGPDNGPGVVFSWPTNDPRSVIAYLPDSQEWIPAVQSGDLPAGRYWVGFTKQSMPTPQDLAWANQFEGGGVVLGDRYEWMIPAAGMLPKDVVLQPDGRPVEEVQLQYRDFWEMSQPWFEWMASLDFDNPPTVDWCSEAWALILRAIGMNYMITPEVVSHLRLINSSTRANVMVAIMGGMQITDEMAAQKKTEPQHVAT